MTLPWRSFKRYTPGRGGTAVRRSSSARASGGTATLTAGGATWFSAVTMTDYSDTRRDLTMGGRVRRVKRLGPARAGRATRSERAVQRRDHSRGAAVSRRARRHLVHDVGPAHARIRVGDGQRSAPSAVPEGA